MRVALTMCLFLVSMGAAAAPNAEELEDQIAQHGPREVLTKFMRTPELETYLYDSIASGDPSWLRIAVKLKPASDAASSLLLDGAVAAALPRAPYRVLPLLSGPFSSKSCLPFLSDEEPPQKAIAHIRLLEATLATVKSPKYREIKAECLKQAAEVRRHLQH